MTTHYVAESDTVRAEFHLDGGRLGSLRIRGRELLHSSDPREDVWFGGFLMVPWAGVLPDRTVEFDGERHVLPANWGEHSLHGLARGAEFTAVPGGIRATMPGTWPFGGTVELEAHAGEDRLSVSIRIDAKGSPLPAAIGWHPWFRRRVDGAELSFALPGDAEQRELDASGAPTGRWTAPRPGPWDDCFRTARPIELRWGGMGTLRLHSDGGYLGLYDGQPDAVAVEPMNAPPGTLPHRVEPGGSLALTAELEWSDE
ncbi:aldose 1-epimerase [Streptomyces albipurpureus]|uniref:Aldose 1-epimerase n=1 Tax=Streptomyces albipurpureus TaxID=2897419 RepID=A0ABT0UHV2_9ACTN|nr:aldose 1-epimerase [Streptomyces sp. CWNU-1]MCM2387609.1 aldose 1-epimerase [Streptomyces sp. CWNU-1]